MGATQSDANDPFKETTEQNKQNEQYMQEQSKIQAKSQIIDNGEEWLIMQNEENENINKYLTNSQESKSKNNSKVKSQVKNQNTNSNISQKSDKDKKSGSIISQQLNSYLQNSNESTLSQQIKQYQQQQLILQQQQQIQIQQQEYEKQLQQKQLESQKINEQIKKLQNMDIGLQQQQQDQFNQQQQQQQNNNSNSSKEQDNPSIYRASINTLQQQQNFNFDDNSLQTLKIVKEVSQEQHEQEQEAFENSIMFNDSGTLQNVQGNMSFLKSKNNNSNANGNFNFSASNSAFRFSQPRSIDNSFANLQDKELSKMSMSLVNSDGLLSRLDKKNQLSNIQQDDNQSLSGSFRLSNSNLEANRMGRQFNPQIQEQLINSFISQTNNNNNNNINSNANSNLDFNYQQKSSLNNNNKQSQVSQGNGSILQYNQQSNLSGNIIQTENSMVLPAGQESKGTQFLKSLNGSKMQEEQQQQQNLPPIPSQELYYSNYKNQMMFDSWNKSQDIKNNDKENSNVKIKKDDDSNQTKSNIDNQKVSEDFKKFMVQNSSYNNSLLKSAQKSNLDMLQSNVMENSEVFDVNAKNGSFVFSKNNSVNNNIANNINNINNFNINNSTNLIISNNLQEPVDLQRFSQNSIMSIQKIMSQQNSIKTTVHRNTNQSISSLQNFYTRTSQNSMLDSVDNKNEKFKDLQEKQQQSNSNLLTNIQRFKGCSCGQSKCLKMYCSCFSKNNYCSPMFCTCKDCHNQEGNEERQKEIDELKAKNPNAFDSKFEVIEKKKTSQNQDTNKLFQFNSQNNNIVFKLIPNIKEVINEEEESNTNTQNHQIIQDFDEKMHLSEDQTVDQSNQQLNISNQHSNMSQVQAKVQKQKKKQMVYKNGCTCKKSGCKKKYCECFNNGVKCSYKCRCANCKNMSTEPIEVDEQELAKQKAIEEQEQLLADIQKRRQLEIEKRREQLKQKQQDIVGAGIDKHN